MRAGCSRWTPCTAKKTFEAARQTNSHLLVQVKKNQASLFAAIERAAQTEPPLACCETVDRGLRTRVETRTVEIFEAAPALRGTAWQGLVVRFIRVNRSTLIRRASDGHWLSREETSFYACSAPLSAKIAANAIRGHWGVENRNHHVRDVALLEDASRIRKNPGIFARARSFALNIMRFNAETNIAEALWRNALDINRLLQYRYQ